MTVAVGGWLPYLALPSSNLWHHTHKNLMHNYTLHNINSVRMIIGSKMTIFYEQLLKGERRGMFSEEHISVFIKSHPYRHIRFHFCMTHYLHYIISKNIICTPTSWIGTSTYPVTYVIAEIRSCNACKHSKLFHS